MDRLAFQQLFVQQIQVLDGHQFGKSLLNSVPMNRWSDGQIRADGSPFVPIDELILTLGLSRPTADPEPTEGTQKTDQIDASVEALETEVVTTWQLRSKQRSDTRRRVDTDRHGTDHNGETDAADDVLRTRGLSFGRMAGSGRHLTTRVKRLNEKFSYSLQFRSNGRQWKG